MIDAGWTTLGALKPGTLFETEGGRRYVLTADELMGFTLRRCYNLTDGRRIALESSARVRPLPPPGEAPSPLTEEDRVMARMELGYILADLSRFNKATAAPVDRLLWLLGLTPDERGLVRALAERPTDAGAIGALADLLKEKGREAEGEALAEDWEERLITLIFDYGSYQYDCGWHEVGGTDQESARWGKKAEATMAAIRRLIGLDEAEG